MSSTWSHDMLKLRKFQSRFFICYFNYLTPIVSFLENNQTIDSTNTLNIAEASNNDGANCQLNAGIRHLYNNVYSLLSKSHLYSPNLVINKLNLNI